MCTHSETSPLPPEKIDRAREFLAAIDYDPGVTRIDLERLQELRGKLGHWSICNASLAPETPNADRLLMFKNGLTAPRGSLRQIKQAYFDFWDSMEYIRVQMDTGSHGAMSYTGAFSRVLSLGELLSLPQSHNRIVWLGSDATLTQCAAIDHNDKVACTYSYTHALGYLGQHAGLPDTDFVLIALSEFLSILSFLIARAGHYGGKLVAYAGDNQNVAQ